MDGQHPGTVDVSFEGNVAIITYNCEQNRLNSEFIRKLNEALDKVESNSNINALITTSKGKFYSNGIDLDWLMQQGPGKDRFFIDHELIPLYIRILTFPMLTIAAINGHAYAGGCILTLAHDYRVMRTKRGRICMNEVHIRLFFSKPLLEILRVKIARGQIFHEFVTLGLALTAEEAVSRGIVDISTDETEVMQKSKHLVEKTFKQNGPYDRDTLHHMKKDLIMNVIEAHEEIAKITAKL